jgi:hypothetical protein
MANTVTDRRRIAHPLSGEAVTSAARRSGLLLIAIAVASLVVSAVSFATRQIDVGVGAASVSLLAVGASLAYRSAEVRRVRQVQRDRAGTRSASAHIIVH